MIRLLMAVIFQVAICASCYADRYIHPDNDFDDQYDKPMWWFVIYFFIGLWGFTSKNGPFREFGERNPTISWILFLFVIPGIIVIILK